MCSLAHGLRAPGVMQDFPDLSGHQVYACGAPIVVDPARAEYSAKCALPAEAYFADAFTTEADKHRDAGT
jgi:CDP-4-dehydro-6-deoxyglucose reductase, E3